MPGKIFISYRRDDSAGSARSIYQRLQRTFGGQLFMDVDTIQRGRDFTRVLDEHLGQCQVLLAVIGRYWIDAKNEAGQRRLDDPEDFVRLEIASALKRDVAVIPVLVDGARLPRAQELPDELRPLVRRQGIAVTHEGFPRDMDGLERDIRALVKGRTRSGLVASGLVAVSLVVGLAVAAPRLGVSIPWLDSNAQIKSDMDKEKERKRAEAQATLRQAHADVMAVANDEAAKQRAAALLTDGEQAIRSGDRDAMTRISADLAALRDQLTREYTLTIVSRPGESSGVWRRPPGSSQARNYYVIVEPLAPDGTSVSIPVRNEETGALETVSKFGVRVPEQTYQTVSRDKTDDGIVQNNRFGVKRRGVLLADYLMPFDGGFITKW